MAKDRSCGLDPHQVRFVQLARENARRFRMHEVFGDSCELAALAISNAVDHGQRAQREARYLAIIGRYAAEEQRRFPAMLACVVNSLDDAVGDCLGELFMALDMGDRWKGQFFTPFNVASLMAQVSLIGAPALVAEQGFITVAEPACGAGAMVIAVAQALREDGLNPQRCLHVTATDVDATAAHMAYVQLSLLHLPAIVVVGNSLSGEVRQTWATPAHVLGGWDWKLSAGIGQDPDAAPAGADVSAAAAPLSAEGLAQIREEVVATRRTEQLSLFG